MFIFSSLISDFYICTSASCLWKVCPCVLFWRCAMCMFHHDDDRIICGPQLLISISLAAHILRFTTRKWTFRPVLALDPRAGPARKERLFNPCKSCANLPAEGGVFRRILPWSVADLDPDQF